MQIPFGFRVSDSRMVAPTEVPNGENCGCVCPSCNVPLVAKQGQIKEWHFAHARGADCVGAVESALHKMAKQLIMERQHLYVPQRTLTREATGLYDDVSNTYSWRKTLKASVQAGGLVALSNCVEEQRIDTRRPDIFAHLDGKQIAIEVAFTHFCDADKLEWLKKRNLTTLEIDIGLPPELPLAEICGVLEERLFATAAYTVWLHHAGDADALQSLEADEQQLRLQNAHTDKAFEEKVARNKADKRRKDEFKAKIRDIDAENIRLTSDLTLRIAYSEIRCTMKGHGYFPSLPNNFKQVITDSASHFGGHFNKAYNVWEFTPPPNKVISLYRDLVTDVKQRIAELNKPPEPPLRPSPPNEAHQRLQDENEREIFEEIAAIKEFEGGMPRHEAERAAFAEILRRRAS